MPYDPSNPGYSGKRTEQEIATKFQTMVIQNYELDKYIVIDKEIRGGLHRVQYKSLLLAQNYAGVSTSKRVKGMLVYVEFEDDDSICNKFYALINLPGTSLLDWQEIGSGSPLTINNATVVQTIIERNALTPAANNLVTVVDARTPQEITDNAPVYPQSYVYNGTAWIVISPYGQDPNRHQKNFDTQLVRGSDNSVVTADSIALHLLNAQIHKNLNDANEDGALNEDWSSKKIADKLALKVDKKSDGAGNLYLSDDGTYKAVSPTGTGSGLNTGDILKGGNSQEY